MVVVQIPGDPRALRFLGDDQATREILDPLEADAQHGLLLAQRLFRLLALEQEIELCRDRGDDLRELIVLLARLADEELDHCDDALRSRGRDGQRALHPAPTDCVESSCRA